MYLFLAGTAAGTFFFATLDYLFGIKLFQGSGRLALFATLITLGAGLLHICFDQGHMERIWKVYTHPNPQSVMAQMVWGYTFAPSPMEWALSIGILGAAAAAFLLGYTWLRLSVVQQEVA